MKKILVTGGAGFVGFHLAKNLAKNRNNQVHICDNFWKFSQFRDPKEILKLYPTINFIKGDLSKPEFYQRLDKDYDQIYHLAAIVGVEYANKVPHKVIRNNTLSTLYLLEWLSSSNCKHKKVLFTSSCENYAGGINRFDLPVPTPENVPLIIEDIYTPRYSYAASKILGELAFVNYAKEFNFEYTIIRYHNIYGPRMDFDHVIPEFCLRLLKKENPFKIYGAEQSRAFCYIDDAVKATISLMESNKSNGQVFNVGSEEEILIEDLAKKLFRIANFYPKIKKLKPPKGSVNRRCPDIGKIKNFIGFNPKIGLDEGLKRTFKYYKNNLNL